jgi:biopolymer transport protein ExbB
MQQPLGFAHFLAQADVVGHVLLVLLALMSVATWYLIVIQGLEQLANAPPRARVSATFLGMRRTCSRWPPTLKQNGVADPFSHLTHHGLRAAEQHRDKRGGRMIESGSADEFLTRALRRAIEQDTARLEYGHTVLASVASSAPFVGLFGTVWGIYHALLAIGMSGQGTLDKVAGPVGEALIMTALGLAVAIPAVLAYNAFTRANRCC